jgi:RNA polymerase sigma-B factor
MNPCMTTTTDAPTTTPAAQSVREVRGRSGGPLARDEVPGEFARLRDTGDPEVRARLIEQHLGLARVAARRFANRGCDLDDLIQVAYVGLVKAVDRFDPSHDVKFATFAMPTMLGELRRHFRDKTWAMRVPRRLKELHVDLRAARDRLESTLGRTPTVDELAGDLDVTPEEVLEALDAGSTYRMSSLDKPVDESDDAPAPAVGGADPRLERSPERVALHQALNGLSERDRRIVWLRFFEDKNQDEIARDVGISQVHVSRVLRATLDRLRDELAGLDAA